jgi:excisionase family DNA binding protein
MENKELMTRAQVMAYLQISAMTLHRLMKRHAFPYIKFETKVLFKKSDIDAYLEAHLVKPSGGKN